MSRKICKPEAFGGNVSAGTESRAQFEDLTMSYELFTKFRGVPLYQIIVPKNVPPTKIQELGHQFNKVDGVEWLPLGGEDWVIIDVKARPVEAHTFKHGKMGIAYDKEGVVEKVEKGTPADVKGIEPGAMIVKFAFDGAVEQTYSQVALASAETGPSSYTVTFLVREPVSLKVTPDLKLQPGHCVTFLSAGVGTVQGYLPLHGDCTDMNQVASGLTIGSHLSTDIKICRTDCVQKSTSVDNRYLVLAGAKLIAREISCDENLRGILEYTFEYLALERIRLNFGIPRRVDAGEGSCIVDVFQFHFPTDKSPYRRLGRTGRGVLGLDVRANYGISILGVIHIERGNCLDVTWGPAPTEQVAVGDLCVTLPIERRERKFKDLSEIFSAHTQADIRQTIRITCVGDNNVGSFGRYAWFASDTITFAPIPKDSVVIDEEGTERVVKDSTTIAQKEGETRIEFMSKVGDKFKCRHQYDLHYELLGNTAKPSADINQAIQITCTGDRNVGSFGRYAWFASDTLPLAPIPKGSLVIDEEGSTHYVQASTTIAQQKGETRLEFMFKVEDKFKCGKQYDLHYDKQVYDLESWKRDIQQDTVERSLRMFTVRAQQAFEPLMSRMESLGPCEESKKLFKYSLQPKVTQFNDVLVHDLLPKILETYKQDEQRYEYFKRILPTTFRPGAMKQIGFDGTDPDARPLAYCRRLLAESRRQKDTFKAALTHVKEAICSSSSVKDACRKLALTTETIAAVEAAFDLEIPADAVLKLKGPQTKKVLSMVDKAERHKKRPQDIAKPQDIVQDPLRAKLVGKDPYVLALACRLVSETFGMVRIESRMFTDTFEQPVNINTNMYLKHSQAIHTFNGEIGIDCDEDGIVQDVLADKPAHSKGISAGHRIANVGTNPFSVKRLKDAENSGSDYTVTVVPTPLLVECQFCLTDIERLQDLQTNTLSYTLKRATSTEEALEVFELASDAPTVILVGAAGARASSLSDAICGTSFFESKGTTSAGSFEAMQRQSRWSGKALEPRVSVVEIASIDHFQNVPDDISTCVLVLNSDVVILDKRLEDIDKPFVDLLVAMEEMFSTSMWQNIVLGFTHWYSDNESLPHRATTEEALARKWTTVLRKCEHLKGINNHVGDVLPAIFLDSSMLCFEQPLNRSQRAQKEQAERQIRKLKEMVLSMEPLDAAHIKTAAQVRAAILGQTEALHAALMAVDVLDDKPESLLELAKHAKQIWEQRSLQLKEPSSILQAFHFAKKLGIEAGQFAQLWQTNVLAQIGSKPLCEHLEQVGVDSSLDVQSRVVKTEVFSRRIAEAALQEAKSKSGSAPLAGALASCRDIKVDKTEFEEELLRRKRLEAEYT